MNISLSQLNYRLKTKPLLVGGRAMEFYHLRKSGADIDFIVTAEDYAGLAEIYPDKLKNLAGDLGVGVFGFELWKTICSFGYKFLAQGAFEKSDYKVISLEKLLFLKSLGIAKPKFAADVRLLVQKIFDIRYHKDKDYSSDYFDR